MGKLRLREDKKDTWQYHPVCKRQFSDFDLSDPWSKLLTITTYCLAQTESESSLRSGFTRVELLTKCRERLAKKRGEGREVGEMWEGTEENYTFHNIVLTQSLWLFFKFSHNLSAAPYEQLNIIIFPSVI